MLKFHLIKSIGIDNCQEMCTFTVEQICSSNGASPVLSCDGKNSTVTWTIPDTVKCFMDINLQTESLALKPYHSGDFTCRAADSTLLKSYTVLPSVGSYKRMSYYSNSPE